MESFHVFYLHTKLIYKNLERCQTTRMCEKKNNTGVNEAILVKEEECEEAEYLQSANDDDDNISKCSYLLLEHILFSLNKIPCTHYSR